MRFRSRFGAANPPPTTRRIPVLWMCRGFSEFWRRRTLAHPRRRGAGPRSWPPAVRRRDFLPISRSGSELTENDTYVARWREIRPVGPTGDRVGASGDSAKSGGRATHIPSVILTWWNSTGRNLLATSAWCSNDASPRYVALRKLPKVVLKWRNPPGGEAAYNPASDSAIRKNDRGIF